jgi:hypothetical protein
MEEKFIYSDLGQQSRGTRVQFTLRGNAANVMLLDSSNFSAYKSGRQFRYTGGLMRQSPVVLAIPNPGRWYGVVDMRGLGGHTNASIQVLPGPLPPLREMTQAPLANIQPHPEEHFAEAKEEPAAVSREWDVFISHATEDKDEVVRPLAEALQGLGLRVWYDEYELRIGDSLRRKIDDGLIHSQFGVVVLSPAFFAKNWPQYELDGLVTREMSGQQVILPLWHNLTKTEVMKHSPSLADKVARTTAVSTTEEIATEIGEVVGSQS